MIRGQPHDYNGDIGVILIDMIKIDRYCATKSVNHELNHGVWNRRQLVGQLNKMPSLITQRTSEPYVAGHWCGENTGKQ